MGGGIEYDTDEALRFRELKSILVHIDTDDLSGALCPCEHARQ